MIPKSSNPNNNDGGGLTFRIPHLASSSSIMSQSSTEPVRWDGMTLDQAVASNPNPRCIVTLLKDETKQHSNLFKELNYQNPILAKKLKAACFEDAVKIWSEHVQKSSMNMALTRAMNATKEREMTNRLHMNPMDEEANAYFGEKIRQSNVDAQYQQMMEQFPESMGRVLMLYIDAEINGHPIQAFVDSGAQMTIMSKSFAERCNLFHLLDTRFKGVAVGVGTGNILGRIHIAPLKVNGHFFPCTISIMDDGDKGMGDKNMDFLIGLDMLKRHRCCIDLANNKLIFGGGLDDSSSSSSNNNNNNKPMETPFLYEKDLPENKGGTKGFDSEKANSELEKMQESNDDGDI